IGEITRRDLYKWGLLTATGALALKNGLSPFAKSAFGQVPTGTPLSPLYGAQRFTTRLPRLVVQTPIPLTRDADGNPAFPPPPRQSRRAAGAAPVLPHRLPRQPGGSQRHQSDHPQGADRGTPAR